MSEPPKRVIRFYGNANYAMQAIGFKEIAFIHIDQLNDPFDPHIYFTTDFGDDYAALIEYVRQNHKEDFKIFSARLPEQNLFVIVSARPAAYGSQTTGSAG